MIDQSSFEIIFDIFISSYNSYIVNIKNLILSHLMIFSLSNSLKRNRKGLWAFVKEWRTFWQPSKFKIRVIRRNPFLFIFWNILQKVRDHQLMNFYILLQNIKLTPSIHYFHFYSEKIAGENISMENTDFLYFVHERPPFSEPCSWESSVNCIPPYAQNPFSEISINDCLL